MAKTDEIATSWEAKATFMRKHCATHAVWDDVGDLRELTLGPALRPVESQTGPAKQMADFHERQKRRHDIMFAASSVRPKLPTTVPPNAVPRAVRAKEEAARRGEKAAG